MGLTYLISSRRYTATQCYKPTTYYPLQDDDVYKTTLLSLQLEHIVRMRRKGHVFRTVSP